MDFLKQTLEFIKQRLMPFLAILAIGGTLAIPAFYTGEQLAAVFLPSNEGWYYAASVALAMVLLPWVIRHWMAGAHLLERSAFWLLWGATVLIVWNGLALTMIAHATGLPVVVVMRAPTVGGPLLTALAVIFGSVGTGIGLAVARALIPPALPAPPSPEITVSRKTPELPSAEPRQVDAGRMDTGQLPGQRRDPSRLSPAASNRPVDSGQKGLDLSTGQLDRPSNIEILPSNLDEDLIETVLIYAEEGSLRAAAERLGVSSPQTIANRIEKARGLAPEWVARILEE